ncbi:MAG: hypothetical protein Edafosvirus4_60 [Edafosvirus sp.]|uniref:ABC1 atypical kinase-like domain-containing protein n=1 Tax=Edafosvirus sp. TaxID=2487765 RepID=A0A3G4ZT46_9VIRU|nr:MAG: hypothetical protein Edafosvirus4_60 [Edafosvirus sp.]
MAQISFEKFINELIDSIESTNTTIIDNITDQDMKYELSCIKPNLTYNKYFSLLKPKWDGVVERLATQQDSCDSLAQLLFFLKLLNPMNKSINLVDIQNLDPEKIKAMIGETLNSPEKKSHVQEMMLEALVDTMIKRGDDYTLNEDVVKTMTNLIKLIGSRSICWLWDILTYVFNKKYKHLIESKNKEELIKLIRGDIIYITNKLKSIEFTETNADYKTIIDQNISKLTAIHMISVEDELNRMIPEKLAALKKFFVKTISLYYNNLHPIVWAQILKEILINFIKELPTNEEEFFRFLSKHLLLNSGPFILKILQQVKPAMSKELLKKYNLAKLTYPVMSPKQYNLILNKVVTDWGMYTIDYDKSASVGHVFIVHRVDTNFKFVIKVAKPLSIAQSCWEYSLLNKVFPEGSCDQQFINKMLTATGEELYAPNEVKNIREANKIYTISYNEMFKDVKLDNKLTTVTVIENVIKPDCWFAFAMSVAPGIPISSVVEGEQSKLQQNTLFRATLHRCLDLLVYKFFINIVQYGFYHGDLHAGNIYFSYPKKQLTMIDFGAVGRLNIYDDSPVMKKLIDIIVMSVYSNYPDLLDTMTELINSKCEEDTKIDMKSAEYMKLRKEMERIKYTNIAYQKKDKELKEKYKKFIFSDEVINQENSKRYKDDTATISQDPIHYESPYTYIDLENKMKVKKVEILDNSEPLPYDFNTDMASKGTSFSQVLAMITEFYALSGVNIAIKFAEFYELLKAYLLILGVLSQTNYPSYRTPIMMKDLVFNKNNISKIIHIRAVYNMFTSYRTQSAIYDKAMAQLSTTGAISGTTESTIGSTLGSTLDNKLNSTLAIHDKTQPSGTIQNGSTRFRLVRS